MHRTTFYRFSKKTGIPQDELDELLVKFIVEKENLGLIYQSLKRFHILTNAHKRAGMTDKKLLKVLGLIESKDAPNDVLEWINNV